MPSAVAACAARRPGVYTVPENAVMCGMPATMSFDRRRSTGAGTAAFALGPSPARTPAAVPATRGRTYRRPAGASGRAKTRRAATAPASPNASANSAWPMTWWFSTSGPPAGVATSTGGLVPGGRPAIGPTG